MVLGDFLPPEVLDRPGPIGRWWRIANGVGTFAIVAWIAANFPTYASVETPSAIGVALIAFATLAAVMNLPSLIETGVGWHVGRWPIVVALAVLGAVAIIDLMLYEQVWGLPLGQAVFWLMTLAFSWLGASYLLAGALAVPG